MLWVIPLLRKLRSGKAELEKSRLLVRDGSDFFNGSTPAVGSTGDGVLGVVSWRLMARSLKV